MAVFTFSTKDAKRPEDSELVKRIKDKCDRRGVNFSALVIELLRKHEKESADERS